jgi:transposase
MAKIFRDWNPEQGSMFPPAPLDLVEEGSLARFVRTLVLEQLDLREILDQYQEERGNPPFHPTMMTALLLYSYCRSVYASRRIAQACKERVDYMALTGMQKPDFRTVNLFRQRHLNALEGLFGQVLDLCAKAGLVKLGHVALDGTKIQANANRFKGMSYRKMKKAQADIQAIVKRWFEEAERQDREDDERYGPDNSGDEMPDWVRNKQEMLRRIEKAKAEIEAEAKAKAEQGPDPEHNNHKRKPTGEPEANTRRNFTDPESRLMKSRQGFLDGYNAQAAVDSHRQVIVAQTLTNNSSDTHQLKPLLDQIRTRLNRQPREVSADSAYCSERNLKDLAQRDIRAYVSTKRQKKVRNVGRWVQKMRQRLAQGGRRSRYRLRTQTVEPVFGQIKQARGFRQFLLRGLEKVSGEWSLLCTAHNLLKLAAARG